MKFIEDNLHRQCDINECENVGTGKQELVLKR